MNEIEKMYKNADVDYEERYNNCTLNKEGECKLKCSCDICKYSEEKYIYPPFTAEKQIELIKWLAINKGISIDYDDRYFEWGMATDFYGGHFWNKFDECLAALVNVIWQDLSPEEKQQVKGILE